MNIKVLGNSGGIGGSLRTTSLLVDDDILIDAGTGAADLTIDEMLRIDHIFLTHSHLDHIACVPLLSDTVIGLRQKHITVHATRETWQILKDHILNWKIWPDYSVIPSEEAPILRHSEIRVGETVEIGGRRFTPLPVNHSVPAVGYQVDSGAASLVFSGDTTSCDALWEAVNRIDNLKYLIIETSFGDAEIELAKLSMHLCPSLLRAELDKLRRSPEIYITHLKPGEGEAIMHQIEQEAARHHPRALPVRHTFTL